MSHLVAAVVAVVAVLGVAPSDGSGGQDSLSQLAAVQSTTEASGKGGGVNCSGKAPGDFGGANLCADSGYRSRNTFAFSNWGGKKSPADGMDPAAFVALFGRDRVCVTATAATCELTKGAKASLNRLDELIQNGRCEGLVVLNALVATGVLKPADLQRGAKNVAAVTVRSQALIAQVGYWWATQFDAKVLDASARIRDEGLKAIVARLSANLNRGLSSTIGIYTKSAGHALLPVGLTRRPDGVYNVVVYDSNLPRKLATLQIDTVKDQWSYGFGTTNPSQAARPWTGSSGTLELTPMSSRTNLVTCDFCNDMTPSGMKVKAPALRIPDAGAIASKFAD